MFCTQNLTSDSFVSFQRIKLCFLQREVAKNDHGVIRTRAAMLWDLETHPLTPRARGLPPPRGFEPAISRASADAGFHETTCSNT